MKGAAILAVDDWTLYIPTTVKAQMQQTHQHRMGKLGFDPAAPYFNAGVLLMDCELWRRDGLVDATLDVMRRFGLSLQGADQDILNILFHKKWLALSPRWNFPYLFFETKIEAILNPVVLHNFAKPWLFGEAIKRERVHLIETLQGTPFTEFMSRRPTVREVRHCFGNRVKPILQYATFFLPSSNPRIQNRNPARRQRAFARYMADKIDSRRFVDVDQGISTIDLKALSALQ